MPAAATIIVTRPYKVCHWGMGGPHVGNVCTDLLGKGSLAHGLRQCVTRKGRSAKAQRVVLGVSKLVNVGTVLVPVSDCVYAR